MIPRYTPADFAELWSPRARYAAWLEVELAACEAMERAAVVPAGTAASIRAQEVELDPSRIDEIERTTKHDVIAFLTHVEELVGDPARWLHLGMTSSDVLDSSLAVLLVRATDKLLERCDRYVEALAKRAAEHRRTPMIGRSHGIHAEPLSFGVVLAGHLAEAKRGRARLRAAREEIAVGKIAGAVGTYAHLSPAIEADALASLGLSPETVSTQVVARDRHAALFSAMALVAAGIERLATNVRHWQRNEVGEAEERFTVGQKGSSAMPHKRNPILSENLCGLARVVRAAVTPALEGVALWHERDISHSSVERMIAPDATATLAFMLDRATSLVDGLVVYPEAMKENLAMTGELYFSEAVMLAMVKKGRPRQKAYELVQRNAMRAFHGEGRFQDNLQADEDVRALLSAEEIAACFDLEHALAHVDAIVDRALAAPGAALARAPSSTRPPLASRAPRSARLRRMSNERRSHVRVRPVPETPIKVELLGDIRISVEVFDVSVGGIGMLREGPLADAKIGSDLGFRVTVEGQEAIDVSCNVRHTGSARHPVVGVAFGQLDDDAAKRIRAYVSDLLERGAG